MAVNRFPPSDFTMVKAMYKGVPMAPCPPGASSPIHPQLLSTRVVTMLEGLLARPRA